MKIFFKKYLILLKLIFVIGSFFFLVSNVQAAGFKIDVGDTNWEINSNGIYKNSVQIDCSDIQIGAVPDPAVEKGFLIKNDNGDRLLLITKNYIYTTAKDSFASLTYPASLSNSFIIKDSNNDIFLYVNNNGLHYKDDMCIEAICGNGEMESGEECDDGPANGNVCICSSILQNPCDYCTDSCQIATVTECTCLNSVIEPPEQCEWTFWPTEPFGCPPTKWCTSNCACVDEQSPPPEAPEK